MHSATQLQALLSKLYPPLYIIIQVYVQPWEIMKVLSCQKCTPNLRKLLAAIIPSILIVLYICITYDYQSQTVPSKLIHHVNLVSASERDDVYVNNLQKCLDASNLTDYFHQEGRLMKAVANTKYFLEIVHKFIPSQFISTLPNHCWRDDVELVFKSSLASGRINGMKFRVNTTAVKKALQYGSLNTLPVLGNTNYPKRHYLPFSCIPEIFLAGFPKCGSSYLYSLITAHPAVSKTFRKEANWFIESCHFMNKISTDAFYFADYLANFESLVQELLLQNSSRILGVDGTVGMMKLWPKFPDKEFTLNFCLLPSVVPEVLPKAKFIVMMREPLSMLYSLFWYSCTRFHQPVPSRETQLKGPDIFHDRVVEKIHKLSSCSAEFPLAKCISGDNANVYIKSHPLMPKCGQVAIPMALYYIHIQKWLSVVPRERFLFLTLEELSTDPHQTVKQVWDFLGVSAFFDIDSIPKGVEQTKVDYKNNPLLAMRNDTRHLLKRFFRTYNLMLAELLGDRKFLWE